MVAHGGELGGETVTESARRPTAHDVARLAGVSQATVSYVLNGRRDRNARISEDTRRRILQATAQLGYVPNQAARSLRRRRTERIAVVVKEIGLPYNDALIQRMQRAADEQHYSAIVMVASSDDQERLVLDQLRRGLVDGAAIMADRFDGASLAALARAGLAIVAASNTVDPDGFDVVRNTSPAACAEALAYLLDRGHRRVAFLGPGGERLDLYRDALRGRGLAVDGQLVRTAATSRVGAYHETLDLLRLRDRPTAIFASMHIGAVSAIHAIRDSGLRVPGDVAVIGIGNHAEGLITRPPLTTVGTLTQDFSAMVELLFSRLRGEARGEGRVRQIEYRLILRGSA